MQIELPWPLAPPKPCMYKPTLTQKVVYSGFKPTPHLVQNCLLGSFSQSYSKYNIVSTVHSTCKYESTMSKMSKYFMAKSVISHFIFSFPFSMPLHYIAIHFLSMKSLTVKPVREIYYENFLY